MDRNASGRLCYLLEHFGGLMDTNFVTAAKQVAMFLSVVSHHKKNWVVKHDFLRLGRTVSKHFHRVLNTILKLHHVFPVTPQPIGDECSDSRWRWFKGCLGALDGTFTDVTVPEQDKGRYRTRKGHVAVNILGVCNPNMQFIYVLTGWEGSAADSRVLQDAINPPIYLRIPVGHYYLCGNDYKNGEGFLTPYHGVRYHLCEWDRSTGGPQNRQELFNLMHSSTRNVIERTFGLLKVWWGILRSPTFYPIEVQNKITMACCFLHNFIWSEMPIDPLELEIPETNEQTFDRNMEFVSSIDTNPSWTNWRDELASSMYTEWLRHI
ncbi:UNVERIFIED_CONTAM: putative nuclease HARBI1 [Sesamum radiatum]|uniref:Nuclease HARBI1 n=1 Tax=Sesamum radiatum TaxID=300843 RepID=A0AAW2NSA2_SESRA